MQGVQTQFQQAEVCCFRLDSHRPPLQSLIGTSAQTPHPLNKAPPEKLGTPGLRLPHSLKQTNFGVYTWT